MCLITTLAGLCYGRFYGGVLVVILLAGGVPFFAEAAGKNKEPSALKTAKKTLEKKRLCTNMKPFVKRTTLTSVARRGGMVEIKKDIRVKKNGISINNVRRASNNIVYKNARKRSVGTYRKVNFSPTPQRLSAGRIFGLHEVPDVLALRSSVAYVLDAHTSEVLLEKNSRAVLPIASISKLMTAMVVLDAKLPMTDMMVITDEDRDYEKGTGSRLAIGSKLSREDMLHIALMASENRAASALSRYFPGGRAAFIAAMNHKAKELGMHDTIFADSTGLTSQNVSSAFDLVKMVKAAYQYPEIRRFSTDSSYEVSTGLRELLYRSTNYLMGHSDWDIGLQKTGYISEAGQCLVMQTTIDGRSMIMILLDSTDKYSRFADAIRVRKWLQEGRTASFPHIANKLPRTQAAAGCEQNSFFSIAADVSQSL
ncbi:serine hydrolase [Candidatus Pandoraea novymonadis]|uniref:D-alanyl-D-alanine endopeptidase n=1 Tax=Candidatus Pandoraea novymonadis TaxID=1808959 RepID=A0ABX5FEN4_9BURK|nr:serine hydrolase [Candidatus Pandoraea novymonadis]PSB92169.1 D-alanyl-D-alanine endopeptidase [Candidatus Pandoraea novymonadis]